MADETVVVSEVAEEIKTPRIFLRNPESGEPWAYSADLPFTDDDRRSIADFVATEIEAMFGGFGDTHLTIEAKMVMMTETEVNALPEM